MLQLLVIKVIQAFIHFRLSKRLGFIQEQCQVKLIDEYHQFNFEDILVNLINEEHVSEEQPYHLITILLKFLDQVEQRVIIHIKHPIILQSFDHRIHYHQL